MIYIHIRDDIFVLIQIVFFFFHFSKAAILSGVIFSFYFRKVTSDQRERIVEEMKRKFE